MGWKGVLRSYTAASNRAYRAARREARASEREARAAYRRAMEDLRDQELEISEQAVARYELQLRLLATVHHECGPRIDWQALASAPQPTRPPPVTTRTDAATATLEAFRPSFLARLFGANKRRAALEGAIVTARRDDDAETQQQLEAYRRACETVEWARQLAAAVLAGDVSRYSDALEGVDAFDELQEVGASLAVSAPDPRLVTVDVILPAAETVVPAEQLSLTQRGKLSKKVLAKTRRHEIYQDYVCGAALRAAREVLAGLPVDAACVTVRCPLVDTSTGHTRATPVLSVFVDRARAESLNYDALDPSDAMANFQHRMGFKKTAGMSPIAPLDTARL